MVIRMIHWVQEIPCIIDGNQKWTGAAPIFNRSAAKIKILGLVPRSVINVAPIRITNEPRAWIKKYLTAASEE